MNESNEIVAFVKAGNSLNSAEGIKLIEESNELIIKEAACDPEIAATLISLRNASTDVFLRRKIILSIS